MHLFASVILIVSDSDTFRKECFAERYILIRLLNHVLVKHVAA